MVGRELLLDCLVGISREVLKPKFLSPQFFSYSLEELLAFGFGHLEVSCDRLGAPVSNWLLERSTDLPGLIELCLHSSILAKVVILFSGAVVDTRVSVRVALVLCQ